MIRLPLYVSVTVGVGAECREGRGRLECQPEGGRGSLRVPPSGREWGGREMCQTEGLSRRVSLPTGQLPAESGRGHWESVRSEG